MYPEEFAELDAQAEWLGQINAAHERILANPYATTVSQAAREYPAMSPQMASAFTMIGLDASNPELAATIRADYHGQSIMANVMNNTIGWGTRRATAAFRDASDFWMVAPIRAATDYMQQVDRYGFANASLRESALLGVSGTAGFQAGAALAGGETDVSQLALGGSPFMPNRDPLGRGIISGWNEELAQLPGVGRRIENNLRMGAPVEEATMDAYEWAINRYGIDLQGRAFDAADTVQNVVTQDGIRYEFGVSRGRVAQVALANMQLVQPRSIPANLISGMLDFTGEVFFDVWDPQFTAITRNVARGRRIQPQTISTPDEAIRVNGGIKIEDFNLEGHYHGETAVRTHGFALDSRMSGRKAEGYVFHGGEAIDEGVDFTGGGLSHDLERAVGYAENQPNGVVYVFPVDELPGKARDMAQRGLEIEQYTAERAWHEGTFGMDQTGSYPPEVWDEATVRYDAYRNAKSRHERLQAQLIEVENQARTANPDLDEALNDLWRKEWDYGYEDDLEWEMFDHAPNTREQIIEAYATPEEAKAIFDAERRARQAGETADYMYHTTLEEADRQVRHLFSELEMGDGEVVAGAWALPEPIQIPAADARKMLDSGYFFPDGIGAHDEAMGILESVGVGKTRGEWGVQDAQAYMENNGAKLLDDLNDRSIPEFRKFERLRDAGIPAHDIMEMLADMRQGRDLAPHVNAWINNRRLTDAIGRDKSVRTQVQRMASDTRMVGSTRMPATKRIATDWARRYAAQSSGSYLDPFDFDATADTIIQLGNTLGTSPARMDEILQQAWRATGNYRKMQDISGLIIDEISIALRKQGYAEDDIAKAFDAYFTEQQTATLYNIDLAGNPIGSSDEYFELRSTPGGLKYRVLLDQPLLDSQLSMSMIHVPSVREVRQATSKGRKILNAVRSSPVILDPSVATRAANAAFATWRNVQLLRPGWMMSVIPDELARFYADGHSELLRNPMLIWALVMNRAGGELPSGALLDELAELEGGLGIRAFRGFGTDEPIDQVLGVNSGTWQPIDVYDVNPVTGERTISYEGARQLARNYIQMWASDLQQAVFQFEGDTARAADWLLHHPDSPLEDIWAGRRRAGMPDPKGRIGRIQNMNPDNQAIELEYLLQDIDASAHLIAGGDYIRRNPEDPTQWLNSGGAPVNTYEGAIPGQLNANGTQRVWSATSMREEILRRDPTAQNLHSLNGEKVTVNDLRQRLMEMDGISVDPTQVPRNQRYVYTQPADTELRNLIGHGKTESQYATNTQIGANILTEMTPWTKGETVYIARVAGEDGEYPRLAYVSKNATAVPTMPGTDIVAIRTADLSPEDQIRFLEATVRGEPIDVSAIDELSSRSRLDISGDEITQKLIERVEAGEHQWMAKDMDADDIEAFAEYLRTQAFSDEFPAPERIKGPSRVAGEKATGIEFIEKMFETFGRKPSEVAVRNPYSKVRTWETFADYWLYANATIRAQIEEAAAAANIPAKDWDRFVQGALTRQGLTEIPATPASFQPDLETIEDIAVSAGIQNTRDLFFDLSKRGNWADATKLIFPFADAWWEVLTRWTKLFNPMRSKEAGQPFRNLRRMQQFTHAASNSGWYDTNERGERVFTFFPGPAMAAQLLGMGPPDALAVSDQVPVGNLGFIDFGDIRSVLGPGSSPLAQITAAAVRPALDKTPEIQRIFDWAVYGGYDPVSLSDSLGGLLFPTYMRNFQARLRAGEFDQEFASLATDIANGLVATQDEYANFATDPRVMQDLVDESQRLATMYGTIKVVSSWITPTQPRMVTEVVRNDDSGEAIKLTALASDYAFLLDYYDTDTALEMVQSWYGADPLDVGRKSYAVVSLPLTRTGYEFHQMYPEAREAMPFTVAAFMPQTGGEEFYSPEYQRQIDENERQKLTVAESLNVVSYSQGQGKMQEVQDERDRRLLEAEHIYGKDSDTYRQYRDTVVTPWYNNAKRSVETEYFGMTVGGGGPAGILRRPTRDQVKNEMLAIGTFGSEANLMAMKINPELTGMLEKVATWWRENENLSIGMGHEANWWFASSAETEWEAESIRAEFRRRVATLAGRASTPEVAAQIQWYTQNVITPVMHGYDLNQPFIVTVEPLLLPEE